MKKQKYSISLKQKNALAILLEDSQAAREHRCDNNIQDCWRSHQNYNSTSNIQSVPTQVSRKISLDVNKKYNSIKSIGIQKQAKTERVNFRRLLSIQFNKNKTNFSCFPKISSQMKKNKNSPVESLKINNISWLKQKLCQISSSYQKNPSEISQNTISPYKVTLNQAKFFKSTKRKFALKNLRAV